METVLFPTDQLVVLLVGFFVPLVGYVLNRYAPWIDETVKATVQVALSAGAGAIYTAVADPSFGFNNVTLQLVLSAVVSALVAHKLLWQPARANVKLGATDELPNA
jgi:hypothetical protein